MAVQEEEHGGGCCGRYHISDFESHLSLPSTVTRDVKNVKEILSSFNECGEDAFHAELGDEMGAMCAEICLVPSQYNARDKDGIRLLDHLSGLGFKEVYEFTNPNSSNEVKVLMYSRNKV